MGGKTKQTQRTKNNAKPSNSGRSAELLGASVPAFVGFSAHSDLGMIPFAPGFSTIENLPETFDSSISTQFQLVLRKMSKKDPITKVKALQEFTDLINDSEIDMVKGILPLWPKFYHNLANDVDHRVRESAQNVQSLIVSKCKKAVAPYIKQLTPVWISSQFDNYPPAASTAIASFQSVFVANKMQEVCLFCQQEILDFVTRNLTFHTATTLTSTKTCTPEEAEHKYQRTVACSLKTLSFFLEKTAGSDLSAGIEKIHSLLSHQKFWTFAKHRTAYIRSAWFELIYNVLLHIPQSSKEIKGQLIPLCFQNIDDKDPLTAPHVWGCILLLQSAYDDWYKSIHFKKNVQGKLSTFLRSACSGNAESVCPNLLPFLSKLTQETLQDVPVEEFYKDFFKDIKAAITSASTTSKGELSSLTVAFYECIRFILQRVNMKSKSEDVSSDFSQYILDEYINETLKWALTTDKIGTKGINLHTSTLIAYWSDQTDSQLYSKMVEGFWQALAKDVSETTFTKQYLENVVDLTISLYYANPTLQINKVKFTTADDEDTTDGGGRQKSKPTRAYIQTNLRQLVVLLVQKCLLCLSDQKNLDVESEIHQLIKLYGDAKFYAEVSGENDLEVTLNRLTDFVCESASVPSEVILEIVFDILNYMDKEKKMLFINRLLKTKKPSLQQSILQRLLSYPMCIEPEVRDMLSQDHVIEIILQTAEEILVDDSKEKFNLLHKCFFQTDSGEILINQKTVDGILNITTKPLIHPDEYRDMMDSCGSFIAQIMPVVCSNNASEQAQKDTFLKLFQFTINQRTSDDLSEDTLWEVTTCWQDALSSEDIIMDEVLLQKCSEIISQRLSDDITPAEIDSVADSVSKLILCSTENSEEGDKRQDLIDSHMKILFKPANENFTVVYEKVSKFCVFLEVVQGSLTVTDLPDDAGRDHDLDLFFRRSQLNLTALMKMVCAANVGDMTAIREKPADDEECTEDYFDPNENLLKKWTSDMFDFVFECIKVAAMGESLIQNKSKMSKDLVEVILEISEKGKVLLRAINEENSAQIKDRLLKNAAFNDVAATRAIRYLVEIPQYATFQESALILLQEDLTEYFITRESQATYVNLMQFILPDITSRVINSDNPILRKDSNVWQKCAVFRCLLTNNFEASSNQISDRKIVSQVLNYITEVSENQKQSSKELLLYNTDVAKQDVSTLAKVVEYIRLLNDVLHKFPYELTIKHWDAIRIGLSSWVLSVSKSMENYTNAKVSIFVTAVYKLYGTLAGFIKSEKTKSSTEILSNMIDEWENLFSKEVNLVLFRSFFDFISLTEIEGYSTCYTTIFKEISASIQSLDYAVIYMFCKTGKKITLDSLINTFLNNIASPMFNLRITSVDALCQLSEFFIATDMEIFEKRSDVVDAKASGIDAPSNWHFLHKFKDHLETYESAILKYLDEFSFKMTELAELKPIDKESALSYMLLWECILNVCRKAPVELRSVYTSWLTEHKFDQSFLNFLFRAMPVEILKNHDSKIMSNDLFRVAKWDHLKNENVSIEKYACYLYSAVLSKLPAVVRKWWNASHSRQKVFVDKLTTNFVSGIICHQELDTIGEINIKEKQNNMQVTVHTSTREVNAVYFIDEARMELIITLAANYPLGGVKVESGKQIGGRASSRNTAMQLTIFLTHQNGSIFDGLLLWKKNLDKKFEGVEECYVCYTVIHQDTCQLPKLTCKTCRKKFHSPCLYKWFTTSSKSTCPICRNIF